MRSSPSTAALLVVAIVLAFLAGCAGDDSEPAPENGDAAAQPADPAESPESDDSEAVAVIEEWSETLRSGDERGAAELFATPSLVDNGTGPLPLEDGAAALAFNRSLPCGAKLLTTEQQGEQTIATFRLTERPGAGSCGPGTGSRARTAFEVEDGLITVWERASTRGDGSTQPAPSDPV